MVREDPSRKMGMGGSYGDMRLFYSKGAFKFLKGLSQM